MFSIRESLSLDDILIVPKYSDITSRSTIDLSVQIRDVKYKHPIIPANMQTICGEVMANAVIKSGGLALLHRFMPLEEQVQIAKNFYDKSKTKKNKSIMNYVGFSIGVKEEYKEHIQKFADLGVNIFCIDIAHGDSKHCVDMTNWIRNKYPKSLIISGNVATGSGAKRLWSAGADVVKGGIGGGCFGAGTRVLMANGFYKNIEEIQIGDYVINKNGEPVKVINACCTGIKKVLKIRNNSFYKDTQVTPNHQFWIADILTKEAKWLPIRRFNKNYLDRFLFPLKIKFQLPDTFSISLNNKIVEPSYELGYLFGTLLDNNVSSGETIVWQIHNLKAAKHLEKNIISLFNEKPEIEKLKKIYLVKFKSQSLIDLIQKDKRLPENLLINNFKYLEGLFDGILTFLHDNNSAYVAELSGIIAHIIYDEFPYSCPSFRFTSKREEYRSSELTNYEQYETKIPVYDITVEDETHSFIANNMIVHNSLCTTRIETGNGVPQFTAMLDIAAAKAEFKTDKPVYIISDGGIKNSGDCVKVLTLCDMVMTGNVFAGSVDCPGQSFSINSKTYKQYRGSSTHKSNHIEGVVAIVPEKSSYENILLKLLEGIQSGLSYQGSMNLVELKEEPEFVKITAAGMIESAPHNVIL